MIKSLDPTIMQSKTAGKICELVYSMQKEIKRLSLNNKRANEKTKDILRDSALVLRTRTKEMVRVDNFKRNREFFNSGV
tara:strand:+ start:191 stop:427 length:237 start_codon:yes stop_codon:yes gene_type:complete